MKFLHTSLNTAHSGCKPSTFMSLSTHSIQVFIFLPIHLAPATSTFLQADTQSSTLLRSRCPNHVDNFHNTSQSNFNDSFQNCHSILSFMPLHEPQASASTLPLQTFTYQLLLQSSGIPPSFTTTLHKSSSNLIPTIDVKNVFYVFYFKIKNAFFNVFYFPTFFINKKRWAFLFLSLTTTFSSLVHIQINCTWTLLCCLVS